MWRRIVILMVLIVLISSAWLYAQETEKPAPKAERSGVPTDVGKEPKPSPELQVKIEELIKRLGDDNWQTREKAQQELVKIGKPALPLLEKTNSETKDLEVRARIPRIIKGIGEQIIKEGFPNDGVILIAVLASKNRLFYSSIRGNRFVFQIEKILRLEEGKEKIKSRLPFTPQQIKQILDANKGRDLQYNKAYNLYDNKANLLKAEVNRLKERLEKGKIYILVLPSIVQISPNPAVMVPGLQNAWGQLLDDAGLMILEHTEENIKQISRGFAKGIKKLINQLGEKDEVQKESGRKELLKIISPLTERLLEKEFNNSNNNIQFEVALVLAETENTKAVAVLSKNLNNDKPYVRYRAICGLAKIKGWSMEVVEKLIKMLDNTKQYEEKSLNIKYKLSDTAFDTLTKITGNKLGKDKEKWKQWLKQEQEERKKARQLGREGKGR